MITAVDNENITDARGLARKIAGIAPGTDVTLAIDRDGKPENVTVKIGRMKQQIQRASNEQDDQQQDEKLGLELAPARDVEGEGNQGVAVVGVQPGGEGAGLGISAGDVILKAGGKNVSTPPEFKDAIKAAKSAGRKFALVLLKHGQNEIYVAVPVSKG